MKLKRIILLLLTVMFSFSYGEVFAKDGNSLKKALKNKFLIGVSVNTHQSSGKDVAAVEIVKKNFNSIVAENCMKSSVFHPFLQDFRRNIIPVLIYAKPRSQL